MRAAIRPSQDVLDQKLLVIRKSSIVHARVGALADFFRSEDILVINDAATFPASLRTVTESGEEVEIRLLPKPHHSTLWTAVLFGRGDWRMRTEDRPPPPRLGPGALLSVADLSARVESVSPDSPRLVQLRFIHSDASPEATWKALYRLARPIQYSYLREELNLWSVQNIYAARPWASEMPSAGHALNWNLISRLMAKGIRIRTLTHSTGISSTGDEQLDSLLPFAEFYEIPERTALAIAESRAKGGRIIAVGTSVVRALESGAIAGGGVVRSGPGETNLVIRAGFERQVADGILTGIHDLGESHFRLLEAFADRVTLALALEEVELRGYLTHEFGDSSLILTEKCR